MIADETILALVAGPVGLGVGAALLKAYQAWRAHTERMADRRLEMEHDEEVRRIEAEHQARIIVAAEEAKARIAEAAADEVTGQHLLTIEAQREERTEAKLWERLKKLEDRVHKRDRVIRVLRADVDECKRDHLACLDREAESQRVFALYRTESNEKIEALQAQVKRQDSALNAVAGPMMRSGSLSPAERRVVRKSISDHTGFPAQTGEYAPVDPDDDGSGER